VKPEPDFPISRWGTYRLYQKSERDAVRLGWFSLEVESVYKVTGVCVDLLFRNPLSYKTDVVVDADNAIITKQFLVDFVVVDFIHADRAFSILVVKFGFLYQSCNQICYIAILRNENIEEFLCNKSA
jgi:hypothetical protein